MLSTKTKNGSRNKIKIFDFISGFLFSHKNLLRADSTSTPPEKKAKEEIKIGNSKGLCPMKRINPIAVIKNKQKANSNVWNFGVVILFKQFFYVIH